MRGALQQAVENELFKEASEHQQDKGWQPDLMQAAALNQRAGFKIWYSIQPRTRPDRPTPICRGRLSAGETDFDKRKAGQADYQESREEKQRADDQIPVGVVEVCQRHGEAQSHVAGYKSWSGIHTALILTGSGAAW